MSSVDTGILGAKRATWRKSNPRLLLRSIINDNSKEDDAEWRELFWQDVQNDPDLLRAIVDYWLDNNIRAILSEGHAGKMRLGPQREDKEKAKEAIQKRIEHEAKKIILLNLEMPNGKLLSKCTGAECSSFGGWFSAIAKKVPPRSEVGTVLTEAQVARLWKANSKS